jgi:hypothetical protein
MEQTHTFLEVDDEKLLLKTLQGSVWELSPGDITIAMVWSPTARLNIQESGDDVYPFSITNIDSPGPQVVRARRRR